MNNLEQAMNFRTEGYEVRKSEIRNAGHEDVVGDAEIAKRVGQEWTYSPSEQMGVAKDKLIEEMREARERFISLSAYDQFLKFQNHFAHVLENAQNGTRVLPILKSVISNLTRLNVESVADIGGKGIALNPIRMALLTEPLDSGYRIIGISLPNAGGKIEVIELRELTD